MQAVETAFVQGQPAQRQRLYGELQRYNSALHAVVGQPFRQWLDGSFVSTRQHPNDLDLVSFLPAELVLNKLNELAAFRQPASAYEGLDAYLVLQYQPEDPRYQLGIADEGYWNDLFRKTRPNHFGQTYTKAFVEILVAAP